MVTFTDQRQAGHPLINYGSANIIAIGYDSLPVENTLKSTGGYDT